MNWIPFFEPTQIDQILERSAVVPCLIFKHSTRCSISSIAKYRLEGDWPFQDTEMEAYLLDLIANRDVSNQVAERLGVHHESPQAIVLWRGEVLLDNSHLDISTEEIKEVLAFNEA